MNLVEESDARDNAEGGCGAERETASHAGNRRRVDEVRQRRCCLTLLDENYCARVPVFREIAAPQDFEQELDLRRRELRHLDRFGGQVSIEQQLQAIPGLKIKKNI